MGCIVSQLATLQELYTVAFFVVGFITGWENEKASKAAP